MRFHTASIDTDPSSENYVACVREQEQGYTLPPSRHKASQKKVLRERPKPLGYDCEMQISPGNSVDFELSFEDDEPPCCNIGPEFRHPHYVA